MAATRRSLPAAAAAVAAGALVGVPSTLGVVLHAQVQRVRASKCLPRPPYAVDVHVDPPWASGPALRVAFLGDSLVEGVGAPLPDESLPAQTAFRLAAHLDRPVHMRGYGVAASRIEHVLAEQVPQLDADVDLVLVCVGANDATAGTPPWLFAHRVELLVRAARERTGGAPVVFTGLPELGRAPLLPRPLRDLADAFGDALHLALRRTAGRLPGARCLEVRAAVADVVRARGAELFSEDRYHPNPAGYAVFAEGIARSLVDALGSQLAAPPAPTAVQAPPLAA